MNKNRLAKVKKALLCTELIEIGCLEAFSDAKIIHSNAYNERVEQLFSNNGKPQKTGIRPQRRVAALVVATLLFTLLTVTAVAFRKQIRHFFVEAFETFTRFVSEPDEQAPETLEKLYTIPEVPDGFIMVSETANEEIAQTLWLRDMDMLVFEQSVIGTTTGVDTENSEYEMIEINGFEGHKIYKDNMYTITWIGEEYVFCIICSDTVPLDEVLDMAENLSVK